MCQVPWPKAGTLLAVGQGDAGQGLGHRVLPWGALAAQKHKPRRAVNALVYLANPAGGGNSSRRGDLDHRQRIGRRASRLRPAPSAPARPARCDRADRETPGAGKRRARRPGRVAGDDMGAVLFAERGDVAAQPASASRSFSIKTAALAPRDKASRPKAPVPAKASSTGRSANGSPEAAKSPCDRMLNSASRARSLVGRTGRPAARAAAARDGRRRRSAVPRDPGQKNAYLTMNSRASTIIAGPASANRPDSSLTAT